MPLIGGGSPARVAAASGGIVAQQVGACDILNLVLGPLDLNLLGLEIHLNQVILDIVGQTGAGNLLGNLLCAVVGLLDGLDLGGILSNVLTNVLTNLLNNLLGLP